MKSILVSACNHCPYNRNNYCEIIEDTLQLNKDKIELIDSRCTLLDISKISDLLEQVEINKEYLKNETIHNNISN